MEKQTSADRETESLLQPDTTVRKRRNVFCSFPKSLIVSALVAGLIVHFHDTLFPWTHQHEPIHFEPTPFSWEDLSTKPYLDYTSCYDDEFQCARLELPMDYWNGTTNATISLAVIKKPAVVPVTHPQYGGPILLNPGGPGGSGIGFLLGSWDYVREVLEGSDEKPKHFDLMSFDPRGVSLSRPSVSCSDDRVFQESLSLRLLEEGLFSSSDAAFSRIWSLTKLGSQVCSLPVRGEGPDIKKYVSTASVARDMLEIVERHGEWREKEARRFLAQADPSHSKVPEVLKHQHGKEKINYLGFSYGTYLGNTFAAMYPDRINRLVVDGVVDAYDYVKGRWYDNLVDTEKDMDLFYYHCARVGYPLCALANKTGTTTEEGVKERTLNIIESLYHNPLAVISPLQEVIYYSDVKMLILGALYSPLQMFPIMAELLAELERGDGTTLASFRLHRFDCSNCCARYNKCSAEEGSGAGVFRDATMAIACGDGDDQSWMNKTQFKEHIEKMSKLSPTIGEIWANHRLSCIHYDVRPVHRFVGPWVGNTSHPILEIGNTADPVTPGRYAKKMAEGFSGAVALIQDSAGHCSLSTPSKCTESYARRYFQTGELPEPGTVCQVDVQPFGPGPDDDEAEMLDEQLLRRRARAADFAKAMYTSGGGFMEGREFKKMPRMW